MSCQQPLRNEPLIFQNNSILEFKPTVFKSPNLRAMDTIRITKLLFGHIRTDKMLHLQ